ncbi:hypothetical protein L3X07_10645 [Levilactobacillus brevis]|nr:hypothetical protein [Levilactobacillus brevis]
MLRHTVLHLLWDHPHRYATALQTPKQAALVRWATDAAINDYLTDLPEEALTSRQIATVLKRGYHLGRTQPFIGGSCKNGRPP